jgi:hypothetical protein
VGANESLLGDVVGHVVSAHDPQRGAVDASLVALDDLLEGEKVPVPGLGQQVGLERVRVGERGRGSLPPRSLKLRAPR